MENLLGHCVQVEQLEQGKLEVQPVDCSVRLGEIGGADFYISAPQFAYWKHTQLIIDVVPGRGGMFSLENGEGVRFLVRSRLFTDEEFAALSAAGRV